MDDEPDDMPALYVLDRHGAPARAGYKQFCAWFAHLKNRRLAATSMGGGAFVSTIFLGVDWGDGKLFQTVHCQGGSVVDEILYDSREDALLGHDRMVGSLLEPRNVG